MREAERDVPVAERVTVPIPAVCSLASAPTADTDDICTVPKVRAHTGARHCHGTLRVAMILRAQRRTSSGRTRTAPDASPLSATHPPSSVLLGCSPGLALDKAVCAPTGTW